MGFCAVWQPIKNPANIKPAGFFDKTRGFEV
jgi:hypothetical protein